MVSGAFRVGIKMRPKNKSMKPKRYRLADQVMEVPMCGLYLEVRSQ